MVRNHCFPCQKIIATKAFHVKGYSDSVANKQTLLRCTSSFLEKLDNIKEYAIEFIKQIHTSEIPLAPMSCG